MCSYITGSGIRKNSGKLVNFYYNSGKAWIPGRNLEKLEKLLAQEEEKVKFLENYKSSYGRFSFLAH